MKKIFLLLSLLVSFNAFSKDYDYQLEQGDQLGTILLSLGYKKLWSDNGQVSLFTTKFNTKLPFHEGDIIKIREEDIIFKKNISIEDGFLKINRKARNLNDYQDLLNQENLTSKNEIAYEPTPIVPSKKIVEKVELIIEPKVQPTVEPMAEPITKPVISNNSKSSFNLNLGAGGFIEDSTEKDKAITTSTFTGIQPVIQVKGIYTNGSFGSVGVDLFFKKIIDDKYSFPLNTDLRIQFIPKWNFTDLFRFSLSHSVVTRSYIGRPADKEIEYKLKSNFIGLGIVIPTERFWLELNVEKAYSGDTTSIESKHEVKKGIRFDAELVYRITDNWRIIPGFNYYKLKQDSTEYSLSILEYRAVVSRSFEF